VVDTHAHFWDLSNHIQWYEWIENLQKDSDPVRNLRRDYLPTTFAQDTQVLFGMRKKNRISLLVPLCFFLFFWKEEFEIAPALFIFDLILSLSINQGMTVKIIHVQAADGPLIAADPTLETAWLMELPRTLDILHGIVVYVDFAANNFADSKLLEAAVSFRI
jgi:predicted TIM-barrel fold metal-dependent hydrolase